MEYCELATYVANTITINVTICCYIVTLLILNSALENLKQCIVKKGNSSNVRLFS